MASGFYFGPRSVIPLPSPGAAALAALHAEGKDPPASPMRFEFGAAARPSPRKETAPAPSEPPPSDEPAVQGFSAEFLARNAAQSAATREGVVAAIAAAAAEGKPAEPVGGSGGFQFGAAAGGGFQFGGAPAGGFKFGA